MRWSAKRLRVEDESKFDALKAAKEAHFVLFTREVAKIAWAVILRKRRKEEREDL